MSLRHWSEPRRDMIRAALVIIAVAAWAAIARHAYQATPQHSPPTAPPPVRDAHAH